MTSVKQELRNFKKGDDRVTLKEIKNINKEIARLRAKIMRLRNEAENISPVITGMPHNGGTSDKIGNVVAQMSDIQREIQNLEILRNSALIRLSRDIFEENCLFMRLALHYSWTKIALEIGGGNTGDGIRKMCERYNW